MINQTHPFQVVDRNRVAVKIIRQPSTHKVVVTKSGVSEV